MPVASTAIRATYPAIINAAKPCQHPAKPSSTRLEHLERVSAAEAAAVLVLHPEPAAAGEAASADVAAAAGEPSGCGIEGSSGLGSGGVGGVGGSVSGSGGGGGRGGGGRDDGASALKMQTVMALTAQLMGRRAAVVVQVRLAWGGDGGD